MRILIIEDNAIQALNLEMIVQRLGFADVEKVYSPPQAYEIMEHFTPDLMLVDINLGTDETGVDIVKNVQQKHPTLVLYITGNSDSHHKRMADETSYIDYIIKPIDPFQIKKVLENESLITS
ncbi:response regulator [Rhodohalobacter sulfatireducens]|uniref:Response regulator n=1 Tax=Rhodohalobacter sulfatireducens TaxID=2911366 RepID=A0ABS9KFB1_9BACT|nr:response regulator [Rhodohalobacter sulfatireducens]MCG2589549.1 response regulator [Rhodohalobacter sulfatireducens]MDR9364913.1 response regulator [Balneolaceae bacterium]MDR9409061.1 response regulator [Balneolaceae bacterium]